MERRDQSRPASFRKCPWLETSQCGRPTRDRVDSRLSQKSDASGGHLLREAPDKRKEMSAGFAILSSCTTSMPSPWWLSKIKPAFPVGPQTLGLGFTLRPSRVSLRDPWRYGNRWNYCLLPQPQLVTPFPTFHSMFNEKIRCARSFFFMWKVDSDQVWRWNWKMPRHRCKLTLTHTFWVHRPTPKKAFRFECKSFLHVCPCS